MLKTVLKRLKSPVKLRTVEFCEQVGTAVEKSLRGCGFIFYQQIRVEC